MQRSSEKTYWRDKNKISASNIISLQCSTAMNNSTRELQVQNIHPFTGLCVWLYDSFSYKPICIISTHVVVNATVVTCMYVCFRAWSPDAGTIHMRTDMVAIIYIIAVISLKLTAYGYKRSCLLECHLFSITALAGSLNQTASPRVLMLYIAKQS